MPNFYYTWVQTNLGKFYLSYDLFLGYEELVKERDKASKFLTKLSFDDVKKFIADGKFNLTPLCHGNEDSHNTKITAEFGD